ncbi:HlyD family efflux transporter periplasmic adaptor subunit [Paracoccus alkanivorans]|uniref:HlyD family efflux transporter periplasmic adaptor subunit n=2 Tax=Paracoccus alkanivorans TaxID=2116655 RepID=A0A3M0MAV4_9RHOB|nr:HlyD family efflux transporter periplasmic adaptor subunit [Paracoccus alkanivorans]
MASLSLLIMLLLCVLLIFGQYTRRVRVQGIVLPTQGLTHVSSPVTGWIRDQRVSEGDLVSQGEVLYTINHERTTSLGRTQSVVVDLLRQQRQELERDLERQKNIDRGRKQALQTQEQHLAREAKQVAAQIKVAEKNAETFGTLVDQQEVYISKGISTSREHRALLQAYMNLQTQLAALTRDRVQIAARLSEVRDELEIFDLEAAADYSMRQQQLIDLKRQIAQSEAEREISVTAPRDGKVTGIVTQAGQTVSTGMPLLTILPDGKESLEIQLLTPSDAIGFVQPEQRVLLRYTAFPHQKFGQFPGTVSMISRTTLRPEEVTQFLSGGIGNSQMNSVYRVTVKPDQNYILAYGRQEPLQVGMQLEADILVETRPLYQWILEPLYGLRGYLSSAESSNL